MRERSTRKVVEYKSQRLTYNKPGAVFTAKPEVAVPTSGELSARRTIQLQHAIGNQAVQRMIAAKKQGGKNTIQRFTDEDVKRRAYEIWVERGRPQNQSQEQQLGDMDQARHELRQIEQGAAKISSGDKTRDWHQAERQLHGVKGLISRWAPNLDSDNFGEVIRSTPQAELIALRTDTSFLDQMESACNNGRFAYLTAGMMLKFEHAPAARSEAMRVLTAQLQNKKIARTGLAKNGYVVIVPRDKRMTDLAEFASLNNDKTLDERPWNSVRGVGDVVAKDVVVGDVVVGEVHYAAITEENLLGGAPDPAVGGGAYAEGYSTTSHEFAHMIHRTALTDADRTVITGGYTAKKNATDDYTQATADVWVDGPRINPIVFDSWKSENYDQTAYERYMSTLTPSDRKKYECYASQNEEEYFAQLTNAYLGTNTGKDATTNGNRHNGRAWIERHEPAAILELLDRIYGKQTINETDQHGDLKPKGTRTNPQKP